MVWGAVIGAGASIFGAKSAAGSAKDAAKYQAEADKARLDWEKEQYAEWQDTYGGIEDNLAKYYEQLTPTLRTMQGLEGYEREKTIAMDNLSTNLAQRGISSSGIAAQTETAVSLESAAERARIRAAAPMEVAREQTNFLQVGLGQNPAAGVSGAYQDQATNANQLMRDTAAASGAATRDAIKAAADLGGELVDVWKNRDKSTEENT